MNFDIQDLITYGILGIAVALCILFAARAGSFQNCATEAISLAEESIDTTTDLADETYRGLSGIMSGRGFNERGLLDIADRHDENKERLEELQDNC